MIALPEADAEHRLSPSWSLRLDVRRRLSAAATAEFCSHALQSCPIIMCTLQHLPRHLHDTQGFLCLRKDGKVIVPIESYCTYAAPLASSDVYDPNSNSDFGGSVHDNSICALAPQVERFPVPPGSGLAVLHLCPVCLRGRDARAVTGGGW